MSSTIIKSIDAERKRLTTKLRALDKARALLQPEEEVPLIKRSSPRKKAKKVKRKATRRGKALSQPDRGLAKTIVEALSQQVPEPGYIGLTAVGIVELLEGRGFMFTSKFPSRSVSGLLTILHRDGKVDRTPLGKPRIFHYRSAARRATPGQPSVPPEAQSKSQQRRLDHQVGGEDDGLEARG